MSKRKSHQSSRGSAFVWTIVWLAGMAAIAWATLNFAVPKFEHKLQTTVNNAVASVNESPIIVAVKGQFVTLSGQLDSEDNRQTVVAAAQSASGILSVRDELSSTPALAGNAGIQPVESSALTVKLAVADTESTESGATETSATANEPTDADSEQAELVVENRSLGMPSIDIRIAGEILAIEGVLAPNDDPSEMIETALTSFNLDVVSNGIEERDDVRMSEWMTAIAQLLPTMTKLSNPQINVLEKQITISGVAPNSQIHDSIISAALSSLGEYSLVERISIDESAAKAAKAAEVEAAEKARLATEAQAAEQARLATEVQAAEAEAAEEERIAAEAQAAEEERIAAEAQAAEEERIAAEAQAAEEERIAAEAQAAEDARIAAEAQAAEEERIAAEAKAAEEALIAAETKAAEEERIAAEAQAAEDARIAAEAQAAEDARIAAEAQAAEDARIAAEAQAAEDARIAAEAQAAEDARIAAEAKAAEEARIAAEAKAAEEERIAAEAQAAEEARIAAEAQAAEETRLAAEDKAAEVARLTAKAKATEAHVAALKIAELVKPAQAAQKDSDNLRTSLAALPSLRILFESGSNVFTTESLSTLDKIAEVLMQFPDTKVSIEGHTDATGTRAANLDLSLLRATTVRDYLINKGVSVYNLRALGFGEELPIANNRSVKGRATNRRIDFTF